MTSSSNAYANRDNGGARVAPYAHAETRTNILRCLASSACDMQQPIMIMIMAKCPHLLNASMRMR